MKRNLLLLALFTAFCVQANASVTVEQTTDPEFIINSGYSEQTAETVFLSKRRANAQSAEPLYNKNKNKFVRFCRNLYGYLDPSIDTEQRIHHDIQPSPSWKDL